MLACLPLKKRGEYTEHPLEGDECTRSNFVNVAVTLLGLGVNTNLSALVWAPIWLQW